MSSSSATPTTAARERRIDAPGAQIALRTWGPAAAPTILFVHGYPDTGAVWDELVTELRRGERFQLAVYDLRGMGASSAEQPGMALADMVGDLAAVLDALAPDAGIADTQVHFVGHDWGSIIGWEAIDDPRTAPRIASYTSISGPPLGHVARWTRRRLRRPTRRGLRELAAQALRSLYIPLLRLPRLPEYAWPRVLAPGFGERLERREGVTLRGGHPATTLVRDAVAGLALYRDNLGLRARGRGRGRPRPTTPVQLILARRDRYLTPALFDGIDAYAPIERLRELDAGHWAQRTHARELAAFVGEFVDAQAGAGLGAEGPMTIPSGR